MSLPGVMVMVMGTRDTIVYNRDINQKYIKKNINSSRLSNDLIFFVFLRRFL